MSDPHPKPMSHEMVAHMFEEIKGDLFEIKQQTIKTNGRVSDLERWRAYIGGGLTIVSIVLVPILLKLFL